VKRKQYFEAKEVLEEIRRELETEPLTPQQREKLELHAATLAGALLHPWLPVPWSRRLIMAAIIAFGFQQAFVGNYESLLWFVLLPFFSPRIMGEATYLLGKLKGRRRIQVSRDEGVEPEYGDDEEDMPRSRTTVVQRLGHVLGWTCSVVALLFLALAVILQFTLEPRVPFPFFMHFAEDQYVENAVLQAVPVGLALVVFVTGRALRYIFAGSNV
jgi:hypothetical protein